MSGMGNPESTSDGFASGRIASVAVNNVMVLNDILYEPFGGARSWTWGNGTSSNFTHDLDGRISQIDAGAEFSQYHYDEALRIAGIENTSTPAHSWSYGYDALDRLTPASSTAQNQSWSYD